MRALLSRFLGDRRGVIALKFALAFPVLSLLAAGAIDLSNVSSSRSKLQDIADSAALAGATELGLAIDDATAVQRATAYVNGHLAEWPDAPTVIPDIVVEKLEDQRVLNVTLAGNRASFFGNLLPPGGWNFTAHASATSVGVVPLCILVTGTDGKRLLNVRDSGKINAPACLVHSNKDIMVEARGSITAGQVQAGGSATGVMSPSPGTGASRIEDPFAGINAMGKSCLIPDPPIHGRGQDVIEVDAGVHCGGIKMEDDSVLKLRPGEHWFVDDDLKLGGHLEMKDRSRLIGEDVVLLFDKDSKFDFKDNSSVSLDGRKTGDYAGMVMIATRGNTKDFHISSDHVENLLGVIYVPEARLIVEGKADVARDSAWTVIVAKAVQLNGAPSLFINANYSASDVPVPNGVGSRSGGAHLVD